MDSVYIKVPVSERLPVENETYYMTNVGRLKFDSYEKVFRCPILEDSFDSVEWWLEEVQLPTKEEIRVFKPKGDHTEVDLYDQGFWNGLQYLLNHIKKGGDNV